MPRFAFALLAVLAIPACSSPASSDIDASSIDAAAEPDAASDASEFVDAAEPIDAPIAEDAFTEVDADLACNGIEAPMPMGICDGRGMTGCRLWAEENAGTPGMAAAICIQMGTGGCARANACVDARDPSTCTCGDGPACDPLEVCAWDTPDGLAHCRCITPATP